MSLAVLIPGVTALLALAFAVASTGPGGLIEAAGYALAAGFGLEFLISSWRHRAG